MPNEFFLAYSCLTGTENLFLVCEYMLTNVILVYVMYGITLNE